MPVLIDSGFIIPSVLGFFFSYFYSFVAGEFVMLSVRDGGIVNEDGMVHDKATNVGSERAL